MASSPDMRAWAMEALADIAESAQKPRKPRKAGKRAQAKEDRKAALARMREAMARDEICCDRCGCPSRLRWEPDLRERHSSCHCHALPWFVDAESDMSPGWYLTDKAYQSRFGRTRIESAFAEIFQSIKSAEYRMKSA